MKKTVLITGASRGIGRACAVRFAKAGYQVAINYNQSEQAAITLMEELCALGHKARIFQADISDAAQANQLIEDVTARFGMIDVLVNNAGIAQQKLFCDITDEDWRAMMDVNVSGVFYTCRAALPQMIRRKAGRIINLSSIWGITGASCEVHYSASKAAVIGLTKALAKEVGPSGITVNCVAPGAVDTDMNAHLEEAEFDMVREETPLGRMGTADEIAAAVLFLAGEDATFITGQVLSPNGGIVI